MRSLKISIGTALATTTLLFTAPMASAADSQCDPATAAAMEAESAYKAALTDYQKIVDGGGHPDQSQRDNVDQLKQKSDSAASEAQRVCGDQVMNPTSPSSQHPSGKPSGAMHTGSGSTSGDDGTAALAVAGGAAVLAAAGFALRRRPDSRRH